ncbi:hypothetical protein QN360_05985 [Glaciimonas sp. CA11.2]|uniref:hypothetical protein n=1 Tax=Glaciimonas sp. CA11.2 TaxID=3048601 RepID=UPI002AB35590|nr:hypothetical protein [Glaciimonas sp. CA11.2]MDY7547608.1 hypothetical protein [Glaciimonas sp. CA11.2]MEB0162454.1 hypothetical protein [Glaciimonas sp. CA11.2]
MAVNKKCLANYGWRYRRGMPISSSIAASAVNEGIRLGCPKKRQMRRTDKGVRLPVQVCAVVLNGVRILVNVTAHSGRS